MRELQYPIRGERWRSANDEYYYLQEHAGISLGDMVKVELTEQEGELVTIVRIVKRNPPDYFVGIVRMPDGGGENGYATEHGDILGIPDYDRNTNGFDFNHIVSLYSGPCKKCISNCKGEERCVFYREEIEE